jgi:Plasmid pRiA4b ORF-3-like protein
MAGMPKAKSPQPGTRASGHAVYTIKVTLRGSKPPIWRRLQVLSDCTLSRLHDIIQTAFGWEDYHMWAFEAGGEQYGVADRELEIRSAAAKRLSRIVPGTGDRLRYTYDFGDDWEHDIVVEAVGDVEAGVSYPRCVAGRRACPPEDCGGIWGYSDLLEVLADPAHKEHEDRLEWLGLSSAAEFDPDAFDLDQVNTGLSART